MDLVLIIIGALCLVMGLIGCFLPVIPGPPVSYIGLLLLHFTDDVHFTATQLIVWAVLVIIVQLADYITPALGSRYGGGTRWGNWGAVIGMLTGVFVFPPWGVLAGPFVGAVVGELVSGRELSQAFRAGLGTFIGFLISVVLKVTLCGYFIFCFIRALI